MTGGEDDDVETLRHVMATASTFFRIFGRRMYDSPGPAFITDATNQKIPFEIYVAYQTQGNTNSRLEVRKSRADHMAPSITDLKQPMG